MTAILDTAEDRRRAVSLRLKSASDIQLPQLKYWNYGSCSRHDTAQIDCEYRACGGELFAHQRVGAMWLYAVRRGILADVPGAGKSGQIFGLLALLKEKGELVDRAIIICQTPAVLQWVAEASRWVPKLRVEAAPGGLTKGQRIERYSTNWDVLVVGYHVLIKDIRLFERLEPGVVITDDVDPLLDHSNQTHRAIVSLAARSERSVVINATNIQTRLQQIHAAAVPVGGHDIFGTLTSFETKYVRKEKVTIYTKKGRKLIQKKTVGYKNISDLREKLSPIFLRRNYDQLVDIRMPAIMPAENVWLELHPTQRAKYTQLQSEVITLIRESGTEIRPATARTKFMYGQEICAGLPALGEADGPDASVKLDWVLKQLQDNWSDRKIVVFIKNLGLVQAFQERLKAQNIGFATIWGLERDAQHRKEEQDRFWNDPHCRVFMGTSAIERSLNLQVANIVVNVDTHLNPSRMAQILGRARRAGSKHSHVFVFNLLCRETQEESYLDILSRREALAAAVYGERQEIYEELSALELLRLIGKP